MKRSVRGMLGGLLLGLSVFAEAQTAPATPPAAPAKPALWSVKGAHGTVYLFGSVHVMKPGTAWETPKIKDALSSSDTVYLEVADIDEASVRQMQPTILKLGLDMVHPLSSKITPGDVDLLNKVLTDSNLPGITSEAMIEPMRPWLVYMTLSVLPALKAGYQPNSGIDEVVLADAKAQHKTVKGFETLDEQLHYLADFPEPQQVELLHQELVDLPKSSAQMDSTVASWMQGDVEKIAQIEDGDIKTKAPELYSRLIVKRNERFADALAALLKDPATGTIFVTIGAAHLAGPDSVQAMLQTRGYKAVRVE